MLLAAYGFDRVLTAWLAGRPPASRTAWTTLALSAWFAPAAVAWLVLAGRVEPRKDEGVAVVRFARRIGAVVPAGRTIYLYRVGEERTSWYLDAPLLQTTTLPTERPAYLICTAEGLAALGPAVRATPLVEADPFVRRAPEKDRRLLVRLDG